MTKNYLKYLFGKIVRIENAFYGRIRCNDNEMSVCDDDEFC